MGNNQPGYIYSFEKEGTAKPGYSNEIINIDFKGTDQELIEPEYNGYRTIWEGFSKSVKKFGDKPFLGTRNKDKEGRPYEWKTMQEVFDLMELFAIGMHSLKLCTAIEADGKQMNFMGVFSKNREEWAVVDLACMRSAVTIVPFFDSLGSAALKFVINQTSVATMCVDGGGVDALLKVKGECPSFKNLVCFDDIPQDKKDKIKELDINLYLYKDILEEGQRVKEWTFQEPTPDTIHMFCYTSGTTGDPKAAMLSHKAFVPVGKVIDFYAGGLDYNDVAISYLPYAHIFEQAIFVYSLFTGLSHGYYEGNPLKLLDDIKVLKPTFIATVPRILNRVHQKIFESLSTKSAFVQWLFKKGVDSKKYYLQNQGSLNHKLYDYTVFNKVKQEFGGNCRIMLTASAPITGEVLTFFKIALGINVFECYGQTESCGPLTVTHPNDPNAGHVGGVGQTFKLRLRDCPELGYLSTDNPPRGEVQYKGVSSFVGYFKNPEKTKEAFDEDGWVNSGDVAKLNPNGSIQIFDRAKNIFKLCQGEYIAPEKLENIYVQCPSILQIFVYGDSLQAYIVGVVYPNPECVKPFAQKHGLDVETTKLADIVGRPDFTKQLLDEINAKAKEFQLNGLERVRKLHIIDYPFTVQNELMTPTFKVKRANAKKAFIKEIDEMYAQPLDA